jgi:hypothetical protein
MARMSSYNNIFNVNSPSGNSVIEVDPDGNTVIKNLVLLDEKTGNKWSIKVSDGELLIEPWELEDKRQIKLKNLLNND